MVVVVVVVMVVVVMGVGLRVAFVRPWCNLSWACEFPSTINYDDVAGDGW